MVNSKQSLKSEVERLRGSDLSKSNKKVILKFKNFCFAEGLSPLRILKYMIQARQVASWMKVDLVKAKRKDIEKLVAKINKGDRAERTKNDYKVFLKKFYKWLRKTDEYPEEVKWLKTGVKNNNHKLPEDLLTEEDIGVLIEAANHPRDKAIISTLYESGCRAGELLSLKMKNVTFDKFGSVITVSGKTGMRRVRLVSSTPYISTWLNNHPLKNNPEAALWVTIGASRVRGRSKKNVEKGECDPLSYEGLVSMLKTTASKTKVKRKINPHNFRHSRATFLASRLKEAQLKDYLGWTQSSRMAGIYVHMSGRDTDSSILKIYGLKDEEEKEESILKPVKCTICETLNSSGSRFCSKCGRPLSIETAIEIEEKRKEADEVMSRLLEDKEVQRLLLNKIKNLKI